jgi:hypothetical protein
MPAATWPVLTSIEDSCAFFPGEKRKGIRAHGQATGLKGLPLRYRIGKEFLKQFKLSHCDSNTWGPISLERCQRFALIALSVPGGLWEAAGFSRENGLSRKGKQWEIQFDDGS